jgi:hypothetical protein
MGLDVQSRGRLLGSRLSGLQDDFAQSAAAYVVYKPPYSDFFGNPWMRAQLLELLPDIVFDVLESIEKGRCDRRRARSVLDARAKILLIRVHESTVSVIDDHELLGAQQIMRNEQRAKTIVGDDSAGVANDMGIAGFQSQSADGKTRVHAGEHGQFSFRTGCQTAQFVSARIDFVCRKYFVNDAHAGSLTNIVECAVWPAFLLVLVCMTA